jgi:hypothetical protein
MMGSSRPDIIEEQASKIHTLSHTCIRARIGVRGMPLARESSAHPALYQIETICRRRLAYWLERCLLFPVFEHAKTESSQEE